MPDVLSQYNHSYRRLISKGLDNITFKAMLLDSGGTFNAAHTTLDQVAGAVSGGHRPKEVSGGGWDEGGEVVTGLVVAIWNTNGYAIDMADTRETAVGASIGPYDNVVIYDADDGAPIWHIQNESTKEAGEATDNVIVWNAGGVLRGSLSA